MRSQFATSSWGGRRKLPFAFTEHGVIMPCRRRLKG
ncbi:ORF6N domain-containing protein [Treponema sp. R6D11]